MGGSVQIDPSEKAGPFRGWVRVTPNVREVGPYHPDGHRDWMYVGPSIIETQYQEDVDRLHRECKPSCDFDPDHLARHVFALVNRPCRIGDFSLHGPAPKEIA